MLAISSNGNGEKEDNNTGSADNGVSNTADEWRVAAQAEFSRLMMYDTLDAPQDEYKTVCDTGANASFCNDIPLLNDRRQVQYLTHKRKRLIQNRGAHEQERLVLTKGFHYWLTGDQTFVFLAATTYASYT